MEVCINLPRKAKVLHLKVPDFTRLLRENNQTNARSKAFADQTIRDQDLERRNLEYMELVENEEVESLQQFSKTLQDLFRLDLKIT